MAIYDYENRTAFNPETGEGTPNAVGQVFAKTDTTFATPLVVTLMGSGLSVTDLTTDQYCQLQGFQAVDLVQVVFKSGDFTKVLNTTTPLVGPAGPAVSEAVDNGDNTVTFLLEDGSPAATVTLPASDVPGPPGDKGEPGDQGLPGVNAVPADEAVGTYATTPGTATHTALTATIAETRIDTVDGVFAALDYRQNTPLVFALCSDSTADQDNEWYETSLRESFATLWPDRAVDLKRWRKDTETFYATVQWQDGIFAATEASVDPAAVLYSDTFNRVGNAIGSNPDVGNTYTGTGTHPYTTDGSKLVLTGAVSQFLVAPSIPAETPNFKFTADLTWAYTGAGFSSAEVWVGKDLSNYLRLHVEGTASAAATLRKGIGGTLTTIATFTNPVFSGTVSTQPVSLELSGTTVTAKIAGETVTATLTTAEVTALTAATREVRYRTSATNFGLDNAVLTGQKTTQASTPINPGLPKVTVYNGGAAGETTAYHIARIQAMYPEQPDLVFINHGHNYPTAYTPAQVFAAFESFLDALFAVHQSCPVVVTSQNPEFGTGKETAHKAWMLALREYAQKKGWGYIPTYEAFMILPDAGASEHPDGLHPGVNGGRRRQADVAKAWIAAKSKRAVTA